MMVYLAANNPLREIAWRADAPGFNTTPLVPDEQRVRRQFTKPCLMYAGLYEGCGYGLQLGEYPAEFQEPDELSQRVRSLQDFANYLREEIPRVGEVVRLLGW